MNKYKANIIDGMILIMFFVPFLSTLNAQSQTTQQEGIVTACFEGGKEVPCGSFEQLIIALKNVINYAIGFALMFSVVVLAVAGFKYMTSEGDTGKLKKAHDMFISVAKGIAWVMIAWLVVNLIFSALVKDNVINFLK